MKMRTLLLVLPVFAALAAPPDQEVAVLAILGDARRVTSTAEGYQLSGPGGLHRAVRTVDGGLSVFTPAGSYRLIKTPAGFICTDGSNAVRRIMTTPNAFAVENSNGWTRLVRSGNSWSDPDAPDHFRLAIGEGGACEAYRGASAPVDGATANAMLKQLQAGGVQLPGATPPAVPVQSPAVPGAVRLKQGGAGGGT